MAAGLLLAPFGATGARAQDAAAGVRDLQAIHDQLRDNSPQAVVDKDSATFRAWLDKGLADSLALAPRINTPNAYGYLLRAYSGGFRDSSIDARPNWVPAPRWFAVDWPGFSTTWRDGGYYVAYDQPGVKGLPPVGAKLLGCENKTPEQIAHERLDRYDGDLTQEADRVRTAPILFWDRGNPFIGSHPLVCDFTGANGRGKRTYNLDYILTPEAAREPAYRAGAPISDGKLAVEPWGAGRVWVDAHSLAEGAPFDALMAQIDAQHAAITSASVVVIDVRGAEDATRGAAYRLANHLWDPDYVRGHWPTANNVVFRVSPANRQYYADIAARLKADPLYATDRGIWDAEHTAEFIVAGFDKAIAAGQTTFILAQPAPAPDATTPSATPAAAGAAPAAGAAATPAATTPVAAPVAPPAAPAGPPANPMKGRVIVLTDYACTGGCLDLLDLIMHLPNVEQAGNTTGTDTIFVEPTTIITGQARLTFPLRAWLDRPRASGVAYTPAPALTWTGSYSDDAGLRAWLDKAVSGGPVAAK
jgi:hypothetical protein